MTPPSAVAEIPAATSADANAHFAAKLSFETDCWDTHYSLSQNVDDFVLFDVRSPSLYREGHVPGALNLPHGKMTQRRMSEWPDGMLFVVYCAGPHCNGADKAAARLSQMGHPVKLMIGGITGWIDEGFVLATGTDPSTVAEVEGGAV
ncbi:MAG: rhodanese-related sulfurtransferase [Ascidiaceihabitans sp.]|jgi:rhodanese-related sulfurtransferase